MSVTPRDIGADKGIRIYRINTLAKTRSTQRERRLMVENEIGKCMVDVAVQIHRETGPGLLETVNRLVE